MPSATRNASNKQIDFTYVSEVSNKKEKKNIFAYKQISKYVLDHLNVCIFLVIYEGGFLHIVK